MSVTVSFQSTGAIPGDSRPHQMQGSTITLGRGPENDVVLPDPEKMVSSRHCTIEEAHGNITVVDISTNGTFLNYGKTPLGPVPTPINDGDILVIGKYEILVSMQTTATGPSILEPGTAEGHGVGDAALGAVAKGGMMDDPDDDGLLNALLGETSTPAGPAAVSRVIPDDFDILADPTADDPFAAPLNPQDGLGASQSDHSSAMHDPMPPVTPGANMIPDDWDITAPPTPAASTPAPAPVPETTMVPEPAHAAPEEPQPPQAAPPASPVAGPSAGHDAAARAFLRALTGGESDIADEELLPTLTKLGHVTRILAGGMREVLMTRTSIKDEFDIRRTVITAGKNNPLKFSVSPEQAIGALVRPNDPGYLDAVDAAQEAVDDVKSHEMAVMAGMEAALKGLLAQLSPDELAGQIETSSGLGSMLKGKKAQYWEAYEKMYARIAEEAAENFHEIFGKEFAKAYQEQLSKLKAK